MAVDQAWAVVGWVGAYDSDELGKDPVLAASWANTNVNFDVTFNKVFVVEERAALITLMAVHVFLFTLFVLFSARACGDQ